MKWTIPELIKNETTNYTFDETIDLSDYIENTDILKISPVKVSGEYEIFLEGDIIFYLHIQTTLTMACALTLKEVEYPMDIQVEEVFSEEKEGDHNIIEGITIDLLPIIWSNILLEKPMRVISEGAYDEYDPQNTVFDEEEPMNQAFAKLKDYKK